MDRDPERGWGQGLNDLSERRTHRDESPRSWPMDFSRNLSAQLKWMQLLLDPDSGAILFRHPTLPSTSVRSAWPRSLPGLASQS